MGRWNAYDRLLVAPYQPESVMATLFDPSRSYFDDEIDWSVFAPDRLAHVRHVLRGPLDKGEAVSGEILNGCLVSWGDRSKLADVKGKRSTVDMAALLSALEEVKQGEAEVSVAKAALDLAQTGLIDARAGLAVQRKLLQSTIRAIYQDGATAVSLAGATGLSVPRINQIVAGGRS